MLLHDVGGPSGANLLGRFCHGDPDLHANVAEHLREEEALDPDALFAEVVHLPEGRLGNVLLRPLLRRGEIPYLGRSGSPADQQIPVTDLTLRLVDDRFVLRSRRLGRRIVPRLTTAHNFRGRALNIYRLLGLLQSEGRLPGCTWDWGALAALPFLPRVTCGTARFRARHVAPHPRGHPPADGGDCAEPRGTQRCSAGAERGDCRAGSC